MSGLLAVAWLGVALLPEALARELALLLLTLLLLEELPAERELLLLLTEELPEELPEERTVEPLLLPLLPEERTVEPLLLPLVPEERTVELLDPERLEEVLLPLLVLLFCCTVPLERPVELLEELLLVLLFCCTALPLERVEVLLPLLRVEELLLLWLEVLRVALPVERVCARISGAMSIARARSIEVERVIICLMASQFLRFNDISSTSGRASGNLRHPCSSNQQYLLLSGAFQKRFSHNPCHR